MSDVTQETVVAEVQAKIKDRRPFVCPTDPAELSQCDSCQ